MKSISHKEVVSRLKKSLLICRRNARRSIELAKIKAERQNTPKGRFHVWVHQLVMDSDKIFNRKFWTDYHER